jgi:uncharacterized protein DUF4157/HNH/ENDO VII superfamily nuclease
MRASRTQAPQPRSNVPVAVAPGREPPRLQPATERACGTGGFDFASVSILHAGAPIQRKARLAGLDDPLEKDADRAAEVAFERMSTPTRTPCGPGLIPTIAGPVRVQRAMDPDEAEAEAAGGSDPALEPGGSGAGSEGDEEDEADEEEEGGEQIQAKLDRAAMMTGPSTTRAALAGRIDSARGGGEPLTEPLRGRLEGAFGADFGHVRVHADARAAELATSVHALAFTSGHDLFFAESRFDPGSRSGQQLLAHELAHVVQQGAAPSRGKQPHRKAMVEAGTVQRQPDPNQRRIIGLLYLFDKNDDEITHFKVFESSGATGVHSGYYKVDLKPGPKGYQFTLNGEVYDIKPTDPDEWRKAVASAKRTFLLIHIATDPKEGEESEEKDKPSPHDPTGQSGQGEKKETPPPPAGEKPAGEKGEPKPDEKGKEGTEGEEKEGGDKTAGGGGGGGTGILSGDKAKKGSKYGWLGLLDLPQPLVKVLEGIIDILGDGAEIIALRDTLQALKEIGEHRNQLADMFKDSDGLVEIALGLKDNAAVTAIEGWALKDIKDPKPAKNRNLKGVVGLAMKVVSIVRKLRRLLKPVFKVRSGVQASIGGVGLLLEEVSSLERLLEFANDPSKVSRDTVGVVAEQFASEFAQKLKGEMDALPKALKTAIERITEADLVTYAEVARGVTAAILMAVPKIYKPLVKLAKGVNLDQAIADNVVAHLIPESTLNQVNDAIRTIITVAKPTLDAAADDLTKIVAGLESGFLEQLPAEVASLIKPAPKVGHARRALGPAQVAYIMTAPAGEPLGDGVRTEAQTRLGHSFADVRIHRDTAAGAATDRLNANAFTVGRDIFFGVGKFAPESVAGRRLLDHELTHVAQQSDRHHGLDLQFDYKDLLTRLAKRFSAKVIQELKGATASSPTKRQEAKDIQNKVAKLRGKPVVSRTNPKLPTGYMYIPKNKGKIKTIRRTLAWIRFIPALTIVKGRIQFAATLSKYDPNAAARAMLRRALGCASNQEAHHVIPLEVAHVHAAVKAAVAKGWRVNGAENGVCVSKKVHKGSHSNYTADVRQRLDRLVAKFGTNWTNLEKPFKAEVAKLKAEVKLRRKKLD